MSAVIYTNAFHSFQTENEWPPNTGLNDAIDCLDGFSHTVWNPTIAVNSWFWLNAGNQVVFDYFSISGHNFNKSDVGIVVVRLQATNNSDYTSPVTIGQITNEDLQDGINVADLSSTLPFQYYRFILFFDPDNNNISPEISNMFIGNKIILENGIKASYTPPKLSQKTDIKNNKTIGGNFIGRSVLNRQYEFEIKQDNVSQQWFINNWSDLLKIIQRQPFMFLWSDADLSDMVFCWTDGDIKPPVYDDQLYGSFNIKCSGYIENGS